MKSKIYLSDVVRYFIFLFLLSIIIMFLSWFFVFLFKLVYEDFANWLHESNWLWVIFVIGVIILIMVLLWKGFRITTALIIFGSYYLSRLSQWNFYTVIFLSCISLLYIFYNIWTTPGNLSGVIIFEALLFSFFPFEFFYHLVAGILKT